MKHYGLKDLILRILVKLGIIKSIVPQLTSSSIILQLTPKNTKFVSKNKMKQVTLKRQYEDSCTLGTMYLDGNEICKTLENPWRDNKENISCIPEGKYKCVKDNTGKYKYWKVLNVPNRSLIEIHNGNFQDETEGCILVGRDHAFFNKEWIINFSLTTLKELKVILGDKFELIIENNEKTFKKN